MSDFTAIQIEGEKINVKDQTARDAADAASQNASDAKSAASAAQQTVQAINLTYNGTDTIIWTKGE